MDSTLKNLIFWSLGYGGWSGFCLMPLAFIHSNSAYVRIMVIAMAIPTGAFVTTAFMSFFYGYSLFMNYISAIMITPDFLYGLCSAITVVVGLLSSYAYKKSIDSEEHISIVIRYKEESDAETEEAETEEAETEEAETDSDESEITEVSEVTESDEEVEIEFPEELKTREEKERWLCNEDIDLYMELCDRKRKGYREFATSEEVQTILATIPEGKWAAIVDNTFLGPFDERSDAATAVKETGQDVPFRPYIWQIGAKIQEEKLDEIVDNSWKEHANFEAIRAAAPLPESESE